MKKLNVLFLLCLFMTVICTTTSCSKDDDGNDNSPASIVGTWKSVSASFGSVTFDYDDQAYMLLEITDTKITDKTFDKGSEVTEETTSFNYTLNGDKIMNGNEMYAQYSLSGNTLTLTRTELGITGTVVYKRQ